MHNPWEDKKYRLIQWKQINENIFGIFDFDYANRNLNTNRSKMQKVKRIRERDYQSRVELVDLLRHRLPGNGAKI
jgi:hypothetical protein